MRRGAYASSSRSLVLRCLWVRAMMCHSCAVHAYHRHVPFCVLHVCSLGPVATSCGNRPTHALSLSCFPMFHYPCIICFGMLVSCVVVPYHLFCRTSCVTTPALLLADAHQLQAPRLRGHHARACGAGAGQHRVHRPCGFVCTAVPYLYCRVCTVVPYVYCHVRTAVPHLYCRVCSDVCVLLQHAVKPAISLLRTNAC